MDRTPASLEKCGASYTENFGAFGLNLNSSHLVATSLDKSVVDHFQSTRPESRSTESPRPVRLRAKLRAGVFHFSVRMPEPNGVPDCRRTWDLGVQRHQVYSTIWAAVSNRQVSYLTSAVYRFHVVGVVYDADTIDCAANHTVWTPGGDSTHS